MAESECLCDRCSALCCRYFALEIDEPDTPEAIDDVRWYLAHESVHVFIEDEDWYLAIQTKCQYLAPDNRCGIYEDRPRVCREYTTDNCDFHTGSYEFDQYFTSPEQLEAFAQATMGEKYRKYAMKQRLKNTGMSKNDPKAPSKDEVMSRRVRPRVKAHPSAKKPRTVKPPDMATLIGLSISADKR